MANAQQRAAFIVEVCNQYDALKRRAYLVEQMAAALRECVELFGDIRSDFSDPRSVCDKGRDIAEAAILRARQAADTEGR